MKFKVTTKLVFITGQGNEDRVEVEGDISFTVWAEDKETAEEEAENLIFNNIGIQGTMKVEEVDAGYELK